MIDTKMLTIQVKWLGQQGFFIWVLENNRFPADADNWRNQLFAWHESSFYGTFLTKHSIKGIDGLLLSPWQALDFFAGATENSLIRWDWCDRSKLCRELAPSLFEAVANGLFLPDFEQWKNGQFGWRMESDVFRKLQTQLEKIVFDAFNNNELHEASANLGLLLESAPQKTLEDDDISHVEQNDWELTSSQLFDFVHAWFSHAITDWTGLDRELASAWKEIEEAYPLVKGTSNGGVVDEPNWLEKIGWVKDTTPFTVGLRLTEPEDDHAQWGLETFLQSKEDKDNALTWEGANSLPNNWKDHSERVIREQQLWGKLVPLLQDESGVKTKLSEFEAWEFLTEASEKLVEAGVEILLPSWWQAIKDAKLAMKAKVKSSSGSGRQSFVGLSALIDFDWRFSTNGVELSEDEFLELVNQQRRLINIRGKWVKLDPAFIKQVQSILKKANNEGLHFRDVLEQELVQTGESADDQSFSEDERVFAGVEIKLNRHLSGMMKQLSEIRELPEIELSAQFKGELRPYQKQGVEWLVFLRRFGFGACLADDMGLGKTIQMIAYFLHVQEHEKVEKPALIICPTSVLGNWQKELEKFSPSLRIHLHYGSNRAKDEENFAKSIQEADVVLTSYGLANVDFEELSSVEWSTICLDEAQNIKNAQTKQSRAIRRLKGKHHIALTGTPMENRLTELWSIFDFTNHGYLGSLGRFQKQFVSPIEKDHNTDKIGQLQRLIRPFLLRRTKTDQEVALNLPDKQEQKEYCSLTVEQASLYEQLVKDTFEQVDQLTGMQRKGLILKMLSKLKQICNHPALYLKEEQPKNIEDRSNKMVTMLELVKHIHEQNESCLIFTQYIGMGKMIQQLLEQQFGEQVMFLNGSVPKTQRDEMISSFQEHDHKILILSLKAGGTGLNLTAANHVIHYDRWWNPAVENQATDRAYRIGQKRFVHVHKLISTGTLEEKIDDMLEKKQSLNDEIIQSESWITELSTTDLKDLFTLR